MSIRYVILSIVSKIKMFHNKDYIEAGILD